MKKSLLVLLAVGLSVFLPGCKNNVETHFHTFSTTWTIDETSHWHEATCEHTEKTSGKEEHSFGEWSVVKAASVSEEGLKQKSCKICEYIIDEPIAKLVADRTETTYDSHDGHKIVTEYLNDKRIKTTHFSKTDKEDHIFEYDSSTGMLIKYVVYNLDGLVDSYTIYEYDSSTNRRKKHTLYNSDGSVNLIYEYDIITGNRAKETYYTPDGLVNYICEYNSSTGYMIKYTKYNPDESVFLLYQTTNGNYVIKFDTYSNGLLKYADEYSTTGYQVKYTYYNPDGSVNYIHEYNSYNGKEIKYTKYNPDGSVFLQHQATEGNYISVNTSSDGSVDYIEEYDITTGKRVKYIKYDIDGSVFFQYQATEGNYLHTVNTYTNGLGKSIYEYDISTGKKVKATYFNPDGTIKEIINY